MKLVSLLFRSMVSGAALTAATAGQAALIDRGGGLIYDTTWNITWLADMNYASTSGYGPANFGGGGPDQIYSDGRMGWNAAKQWADNLVYGGYSDWRLPTLNPSDTSCGTGAGFGFNCAGGELSHLFVTDLGNKANESVLTQAGDTAQQVANLGLFQWVQSGDYWSGTEFAGLQGYAFFFRTAGGLQDTLGKNLAFYAAAVRDGDVASVPEPTTLALAGAALAIQLLRRRN